MRRRPLIPLLLVALAFWDLRLELRLLSDHFTWASFGAAVGQHPLAVAVLLLAPSLWRR